MTDERLSHLLRVLFFNRITENERIELANLLESEANKDDVHSIMEELWRETNGPATFFEPAKSDQLLAGILAARTSEPLKTPGFKIRRIRYFAAAVFLFMGAAIFIYSLTRIKNKQKELVKNESGKPEILPGGNKAVLTLSDGTRIILDSAGNGNLANQGNIKVIKLDGRIQYKKAGQTEEILYNTISTPRGGQYQLVLSDGSNVWLNTSSSLHFPASFSGKERKVTLTGEAYFEVAKNEKMPFVVEVNKMNVTVLGTHFNINGYEEEQSAKTTLLEGLVKVNQGASSMLLVPGQQAIVTSDDHIELNKNVNVDEVVAWKNGLFRLSGADIPTVLRQIARWYDIEIEYEGKSPEGHISGTVPMATPLSKVLNVLELSGINFRLEGRKLIIK